MGLDVEVTDDFATCFAIRREVFINEQNVPEVEEHDAFDASAIHFLGHLDGRAVATARVVLQGELGKIGRVCVLRQHRGKGLGAILMQALLAHLRSLPGPREAVLGSQLHALSFYEKLGFEAYGDVFDDAGIAHRMMRLHLR